MPIFRGNFNHFPGLLEQSIYARPLELFQGAPFSLDQTRFELDLLNYQVVSGPRDEASINKVIKHCGLGCVVINFLMVSSRIGWSGLLLKMVRSRAN